MISGFLYWDSECGMLEKGSTLDHGVNYEWIYSIVYIIEQNIIYLVEDQAMSKWTQERVYVDKFMLETT